MSVNDVSGIVTYLSNNYVKAYGAQPKGNDLVNYARMTGGSSDTSIFDVMDKLYDGDNIKGNSISLDHYYTNDNNVIFQASGKNVLGFNFQNNTISPYQMNNQDFTNAVASGAYPTYSAVLGQNTLGLQKNIQDTTNPTLPSSTIPGSTTTNPGSTNTTVPGSTTTNTGSTNTTVPGSTTTNPGSMNPYAVNQQNISSYNPNLYTINPYSINQQNIYNSNPSAQNPYSLNQQNINYF